jgi:hypothetical protein
VSSILCSLPRPRSDPRADRPHDHFVPRADRHHRLVVPRQWRVPLPRSSALVGASREPRRLYELFRAHRRVASKVTERGCGPLRRSARGAGVAWLTRRPSSNRDSRDRSRRLPAALRIPVHTSDLDSHTGAKQDVESSKRVGPTPLRSPGRSTAHTFRKRSIERAWPRTAANLRGCSRKTRHPIMRLEPFTRALSRRSGRFEFRRGYR